MLNVVNIKNNLTRSFYRVGFQLKKHSPEILVVAGVAGTVTSAVLACKATLKVNNVVEESKHVIDKIHEATERGHNDAGEEYTPEDGKKDLAIAYVQTGIKFVKLYGPAVALGTLSIGGIVASHNIMRKRNIALAAAYTVVDKGFKEYRGRVVERFGESLDKELKYNIKAQEVKETVVDEETGKKKTVKKTVEVVNSQEFYSDYARFFDDGCLGWEPNAELNLFYLKSVQNHANDILKAKGHLFLNEVYDMLGIHRSVAGQTVGWIYDEKNNTHGDNYVDFGIYDVKKENSRDFVNGIERVILLDFNVDGPILNYIEK